MSAQPVDVLAVLARLESIAAGVEAPYPRWLGGYDVDQGPSYCYDCAAKRVEAGEAQSVDGGWPQDCDTCCHCEDCGRLLAYTLTEWGVGQELVHFASDALDREVTPELAYHLARVLEQHGEHPDVLGLVPKVGAALARCGGAS